MNDPEPILLKISEEEMEMIRKTIYHGMPADVAERAVEWFDRVDDLLAVLRDEMADLLKELGL
jgi:hypothetical protein